jgi:hypothetical protein
VASESPERSQSGTEGKDKRPRSESWFLLGGLDKSEVPRDLLDFLSLCRHQFEDTPSNHRVAFTHTHHRSLSLSFSPSFLPVPASLELETHTALVLMVRVG